MDNIKEFKKCFENRVLLRVLNKYNTYSNGAVPQARLIAYIIINWKECWIKEEKKFKKERFIDDWFNNLDMNEVCRHYSCDKPPSEKTIIKKLNTLEELKKLNSKQLVNVKLWKIYL